MSDIERILAAADFAAVRHSTHRRKGDACEPYINHVIEVADLLAHAVSDDVTLIVAGLLHDTIEDTGTSAPELRERFGDEVTNLVLEVSDDKKLPKDVRKRLQVERAVHKSARAQNLKTADAISNIRSLLNSPPLDWTVERKRQYCAWSRAIVDQFKDVHPILRAEFDNTLERAAMFCLTDRAGKT